MRLRERGIPGNMSVADNTYGYFICDDAEPRLLRSLHDRAFIIVNNIFLVKMYGLTTAIALKEDKSSNIEPGHWYILHQSKERRKLRDAFILGKSHVTLTRPSVWVKVDKIKPETLGGENSLVISEATENFSRRTMMRSMVDRFEYVQNNKELFGRLTGPSEL